MNTREQTRKKTRGDPEVAYLGQTVDGMIYEFMREHDVPGLTLAIVQAPYIPRVVGYGVSDAAQGRLAAAGTRYPIGRISQAFAAVAVMQLVEDGSLSLDDTVGTLLPAAPRAWAAVTVLQLLRHASGIADYRGQAGFDPYRPWTADELIGLVAERPAEFAAGTDVKLSATNFLLLTEIVARASGKPYETFVRERQFDFLGLGQTAFADETDRFFCEEVSLTGNVHAAFKSDARYIDPSEPAQSYDADGAAVPAVAASALRGFSDIWASAGDISHWDIALAGSALIRDPEHRALLYAPWTLPDGRSAPAAAGWQFYRHRGLMDIKGGVPGYSSFLSRFTHPDELVCVTLLANKEGVDFTNLARRIAGAFGDLMSTGYDDERLCLLESQFSAEETFARLLGELRRREIPLFGVYDHAKNAHEVGIELRPTSVAVFGSPRVGTALMQADQSVALELPLRIAVWEDGAGSVWLAFPRLKRLLAEYGLASQPAADGMGRLLAELTRAAGSIY